MTMSVTNRKPFTGRSMLILSLCFFGVIVAVNIGMAIIAGVSWTGLVVDNSYVASQEFEAKRIAHDQQQAAGWQGTFTYAPGLAKLVIVDGTGNPVDLGPVTLQVNRPVGGHDDQRTELSRAPNGGYETSLKLAPGIWDATVVATNTPKGAYELHERFSVDGASE